MILVSCHKHCKTLSRDGSDADNMLQYEAMMKRALSHSVEQVCHQHSLMHEVNNSLSK